MSAFWSNWKVFAVFIRRELYNSPCQLLCLQECDRLVIETFLWQIQNLTVRIVNNRKLIFARFRVLFVLSLNPGQKMQSRPQPSDPEFGKRCLLWEIYELFTKKEPFEEHSWVLTIVVILNAFLWFLLCLSWALQFGTRRPNYGNRRVPETHCCRFLILHLQLFVTWPFTTTTLGFI